MGHRGQEGEGTLKRKGLAVCVRCGVWWTGGGSHGFGAKASTGGTGRGGMGHIVINDSY